MTGKRMQFIGVLTVLSCKILKIGYLQSAPLMVSFTERSAHAIKLIVSGGLRKRLISHFVPESTLNGQLKCTHIE